MVAKEQASGTVLVVDDDESVREALRLALELESHPTAEAENGAAALAWLRGHAAPRLVLLDLMMPVMDGWQFLEELRGDAQLASVPVVVITAFGRDAGKAVGDVLVLKKPIDLDDLLRVVSGFPGATA